MTKRQANTDAATLAAMRDQYQHILSGIPRDTERAGAINAAAVLMAEAVVELEKVARLTVGDGEDYISDDQMRWRYKGVEYAAEYSQGSSLDCKRCAFLKQCNNLSAHEDWKLVDCKCNSNTRADDRCIVWKRADEVTV